jgi:hypothetical protein
VTQERQPERLKTIHIDLEARTIIFQAGQTETKLTFSTEGLLYEVLGADPITDRSVDRLTGESDGAKEKESSVTLTGRLKTQPKEGRADRRGKPTAWAKLAVHEGARDQAKMYSATFHRHTAKIALGLRRDALITVQGYVRESAAPQRMDSVSILNLLAYPGKPGQVQEA